MEFIVMAYDGKDEKALERRLSMREAHLANAQLMKSKGELHYAAALLDEGQKMIGSMMVVNFEDQQALNAWLKVEPYVLGAVWDKIDVTLCKIPDFVKQK